MFNQLFFRPDALARQVSAPVVYERSRYLTHCAAQGMSKSILRGKASRSTTFQSPCRLVRTNLPSRFEERGRKGILEEAAGIRP
jgi:hypothetical protein